MTTGLPTNFLTSNCNYKILKLITFPFVKSQYRPFHFKQKLIKDEKRIIWHCNLLEMYAIVDKLILKLRASPTLIHIVLEYTKNTYQIFYSMLAMRATLFTWTDSTISMTI